MQVILHFFDSKQHFRDVGGAERLRLLQIVLTKVSDLVSNGLNDRSKRMQSSMLELLR